jgi:putative ABC transport system permease protein
VVVKAGTVITCLLVGTIITMASALIPARRAGHVPPVAAMRAVAIDRAATSRRRVVVGGGILAAGIGSMAAGLSDGHDRSRRPRRRRDLHRHRRTGPVLARPVARVIGWPMARFGGVSGALGRENAIRTPKRTASTAAALMIGVALVGFIMTFAASAKASINSAVDRDFHGDFVLDTGTSGIGGVSHQLSTDLANRPRVHRGHRLTRCHRLARRVDHGAEQLRRCLADVGVRHRATARRRRNNGRARHRRRGRVRHRARPHDGLAGAGHVRRGSHDADRRSESTATAHGWVRRSSTMPSPTRSASISSTPRSTCRPPTGSTEATARSILDQAAAKYANVEVQDRAEFKAAKAADIDKLLNLIYALLALAIVIALIGISNTLALSIFERTRELGLLRAVGMTRAQLRSTVRWESMIIALFGTVLGLTIGLFFGWSMIHALADKGFDAFVVPTGSLAVVGVIAAIAGVGAAVLPARRAARLDVLGAIATQ